MQDTDTYSSNETYLPNTPGHFSAFLMDNNLNLSSYELYGYHLYLHSSKISSKFKIIAILKIYMNIYLKHFWVSDILGKIEKQKKFL